MDEMYNFFNEGTFRNLQIFLRGSEKGIESITEPEVQPYTGEQRGDLMQQIDQEISSINPNLQSNLIEPAFEPDLSPMQATSATILPDEKDREIAMRQLGGIGSLV
jgi:hypothetical protein